MRAIAFFERDLTHNNDVSGLQTDSSLSRTSLGKVSQIYSFC